VKNVRYTTANKVRSVVEAAGVTWAAQWPVIMAMIDETLL
jgi:hypothetical protein